MARAMYGGGHINACFVVMVGVAYTEVKWSDGLRTFPTCVEFVYQILRTRTKSPTCHT